MDEFDPNDRSRGVEIEVGRSRNVFGPENRSHLEDLVLLLQRQNGGERSEEHTSELQSLMRISYAVFCLKKKKKNSQQEQIDNISRHSEEMDRNTKDQQ